MENLPVMNVEKNGIKMNRVSSSILFIALTIIATYMYFHRYEYKGSFVRTNIYTNEVEILCNENYKYTWVSRWSLGNAYSHCGSFDK